VQDAVASVVDSKNIQAMRSIDWSVDGKWVAVGSTGGGIHVLGTAAWELLAPSLDSTLSLTAQSKAS
jgi:hypothetical protein